MKVFAGLSLSILLFIAGCNAEKKNVEGIFKVGIQPDGSILVPSNQILRPAGSQVYLPGRPVDMVLTTDEKYLLVKNKEELDLIRLSDRKVIQSLPYESSGASFTGICLSPDGKRIYLTDAEKRICVAEFDNNKVMHWNKPVVLPDPSIGGPSVPGGLAMNGGGDLAYVTLSRNNSLGVVNLKDNSVRQIDVGIAPYDVILFSESKAYVSNWGGRRPVKGEITYNSSGSQVLVDPGTGIANNGSVSVVDLKNNIQIKNIEVGLHPSGMVVSPDRKKIYVACANSDLISVIDTYSDEVTEKIRVYRKDSSVYGSSPNDLAISNDGQYLYVACATKNAICVIETGTPSKIMGYIPTGWYPGSVILDRNCKMICVANVKGIGSRNQRPDRRGYNSHDHLGSISIIKVPDMVELGKLTSITDVNNSGIKAPASFAGQTTPIKHIVYIIKENRTYDQVFGDMPQGDGDTSLVMFGREITPNQHKLAESFVLLDNFYCSGVLSADGHQWTDEAFVTDYIEKSFGDFNRSYPYDGNDAIAYASSGFIWDNVLKHGKTFRNYGEFVNAVIEPPDATFSEIYKDYLEGTHKVAIHAEANLEQLKPYLCPTYISFPNVVSDQYRASEFIRELRDYEKRGDFPDFVIMALPANHTSGTRPGMPTPKAAVADNDLALGRIVEALSESSFWKETCILVTEDDPQDGFDHVDGHRTAGLLISPYSRNRGVVSTYYSQINMVRTIEIILGLPPMNQLDMSAEPMLDCFTDKPDFTPYKALKNNIPLDQLNPPLVSLSGDQLYWAKRSMEQNLDEVDRIDEDVFNRIIWHSVRGYNVPYPDLRKGN